MGLLSHARSAPPSAVAAMAHHLMQTRRARRIAKRRALEDTVVNYMRHRVCMDNGFFVFALLASLLLKDFWLLLVGSDRVDLSTLYTTLCRVKCC